MGRGRPKGNINKTTENRLGIKSNNILLPLLFGNVKDLKKEIRALKKLKLQCRAGTKERIDLHRKIKALKKQLIELKDKPENLSPLTFEKKDPIETINKSIEENYPDNNGCSYFNHCRAINFKGENKTCYNPLFFIDKLKRECKELKKEVIKYWFIFG